MTDWAVRQPPQVSAPPVSLAGEVIPLHQVRQLARVFQSERINADRLCHRENSQFIRDSFWLTPFLACRERQMLWPGAFSSSSVPEAGYAVEGSQEQCCRSLQDWQAGLTGE
jgi:hypothetical protein